MKVRIYGSNEPLHNSALLDFARGVAECKVPVEMVDPRNYEPSDVAVVWGVYKKAVPYSQLRGNVIELQKLRGLQTIVIDSGYMQRDKPYPYRYMACGLGGLNGRADFRNAEMPQDRFLALNQRMSPWQKKRGDAVILMGQIPWDASVQDINYRAWVRETLGRLRERTKREIYYRPHPLDPSYNHKAVAPHPLLSQATLAADFRRAHCVVTYNSNSALDAILEGIPAFVLGEHDMLGPLANRSLDTLEEPEMPHRGQWLWNLAYTQWNGNEMKEGWPFRHLILDAL